MKCQSAESDPNGTKSKEVTRDRYKGLTLDDDQDKTHIVTIPPLFLNHLKIFVHVCKNTGKIEKFVNKMEYQAKALVDKVVKINVRAPDNYRNLTRTFREENIVFHTYQKKQVRTYKVVMTSTSLT